MAKGNLRATGKTSVKGSELVYTGRAMLLRSLDIFEERAKITPAEHLSIQFEENPLRFMEIYAKFMPKEVAVTTRKGSAEDYSTAELQDLLREHVAKQLEDNALTIENEPSLIPKDSAPIYKVSDKVKDKS